MDTEQSLKKMEKWYGIMAILCIVFAIITFFLWVGTRNWTDFTDYAPAVARFYASLALAIVFGILSVTVKKIHKALVTYTRKTSI